MAPDREWIEKRYIRILPTSKKQTRPTPSRDADDRRAGASGKEELLSALYARRKFGRSVVLASGSAAGSG